MASAVATPLERQFGRIAGVTEMTSTSPLGNDHHRAPVRPEPEHRRRRARRAGRDQRRAEPASGQPALEPHLPEGEPRRRAHPDPGAHLGHAAARARLRRRRLDPRPEALPGRRRRAGLRRRRGAARGARPGGPGAPDPARDQPRTTSAPPSRTVNANTPEGRVRRRRARVDDHRQRPALHRRAVPAGHRRVPERRPRAAARRGQRRGVGGERAERRDRQRQARGAADPVPPARRQHHRHRGPRPRACCPSCARRSRRRSTLDRRARPHHDHPRLGPRRAAHPLLSVLLVVLVVFVFLRSVRATVIPSVAVPLSLFGTFGVMYLLRLQPGQPLADGAHHLHRLRGGRRHRGDREHHALHRGGGLAARRPRSRARARSASPCSR